MFLMLTSQSADFVHRSDPAAIVPADPAAVWAEDWFSAAGQHPACRVFRVRPLSALEYSASLAEVDVTRRAVQVCDLALRNADGSQPTDISWSGAIAVANLIYAVTHGPLAGRPAPSTAVQATDTATMQP